MDGGGAKMGVLECFMRNQQNSLKALFQRRSSSTTIEDDSPRPIPQLSPIANSVVSRCSKVLKLPLEELQHRFDIELPESVKQHVTYARNFLEFCSYQALHELMRNADYLTDLDFRQLTFDMMLAWENPGVADEPEKTDTTVPTDKQEGHDDGWSLFYSNSTNMAMQVDDKKSVSRDAFARIAPVCPAIADPVTVHNLFDALTSSSDHRLHFLIYDKYIRTLDKVIKAAKNALGSSVSSLQLAMGEIIVEVDGTVPVQPVIKHIGMSAWPGRLTLTNYALYFEPYGVGEKAIRYDLSKDMKQVIKPELTGPLGARLFDKAVMYKSTSVTEPVYFEFPEFKGNARRDFWLRVCLEILSAHQFIRKHNFEEVQQSEVLGKATFGIFRYHAIREAFHVFSSQYKTLLTFNLAESLPGGDVVLNALYNRFTLMNVNGVRDMTPVQYMKWPTTLSPVSALMLKQFGLSLEIEANLDEKNNIIGDFCVGETSPLEMAVKKCILDTGRVEAARATVEQVKVEGIDTNVAVMRELLSPAIKFVGLMQRLASWEEPIKSMVFVALTCYATIRGWIDYMLPSAFVFLAIVMFWRKHFNKNGAFEAFRITPPPNKNAVEQLLTLQEAISQVETLIQTGNVILLKIRAILLSAAPQATERVALFLVVTAVVLAVVPVRYLILMAFLESFTGELPCRRESTIRAVRRLREWWVRIPAAPVQLIRAGETKKQK